MNEKVSPETDTTSASRGAWISWVGWIITLACVAGALVLAGYRGFIPGIAGASILGDGRVSLILDIPGLIAMSGGQTAAGIH